MRFLSLRNDKQSRSMHIKTMHDKRPRSFRETLTSDIIYRTATIFSRSRKHSCRLVDHPKPTVLINSVQYRLRIPRQRAVLHIQSLQHKLQNRLTLSLAGRIKLQMPTHDRRWRLTPPEFPHSQWLQAVNIGILQQFRSGAFSRPRRRQFIAGGLKQFCQANFLATAIPYNERIEHFPLQCSRTLLTLLFQSINLRQQLIQASFYLLVFLPPPFFYPF